MRQRDSHHSWSFGLEIGCLSDLAFPFLKEETRDFPFHLIRAGELVIYFRLL
jgi:hypothetical protein